MDSVEQRLISRQAQGDYFFLKLTESGDEPLAVALGGRERCPADYCVERETYPFPTVELVAEGEGWIRFKSGEPVELRPGAVFAYGPGVPLRMESRPPGMLKYFLCLTGFGARKALADSLSVWRRVLQADYPQELAEILDLLIAEGREHGPFASELCLNLFERLRLKLQVGRLMHPLELNHDRKLFQNCKRLVDTAPARFACVGDMARAGSLSRPLLFRLFKRFQGVTPYQYLQRVKMNQAAHQLLSTELLVKEVAESVGYADPLHFSRAFRQVHKTSPSDFRHSHRR